MRYAFCLIVLMHGLDASRDKPTVRVTQLTHGLKHHFFGYIGQSKTSPGNANGR